MIETIKRQETIASIIMRFMEQAKIQQQHWNDSGEIKPNTYNCKKCKDTGYYEINQGRYTFAVECECGKLQQARAKNRLKFATIPKEFQGHTIENFRTDCYAMPENREMAEMVKHVAKQYVNNFEKIKETTGKGLYFYSGVKGSGKTRLAISIANEIMIRHKINVKFATTIQILEQIRSTWDKKQKEWDKASEQMLIDNIISVPVLIIDDIGVEQQKDWVNERFYNIINGRLNEKRITFFTSNYSINDLQIDDRIVSRIGKLALEIEFPAESIRTGIARKENKELLDFLLGL